MSRQTWLTMALPLRHFLTSSVFLWVDSGACSLLCCPVVCFAQTAVFALHTATAPSRPLPPVWCVNSIREANPQSSLHGLASGDADSCTEPGLAKHIFRVCACVLIPQACVQTFFLLRDGDGSQTQHCRWVWPGWSCLIGILEKETLLWRWGWILWFHDSRRKGTRSNIHALN